MDDQEIIALFQARMERGIEELMRRHGGAVRSIAANILRDPQDVEETVSDTYLRIWNAIPPQVPQSLRAFACGVARNAALSRYHANTAQKRGSHYDVALDELAESIPALDDVESQLDAKELSRCINAWLGSLSYDDRYMFIRRYYYAEPVMTIAAAMHQKPHAVSVRLFRLRDKLKGFLKKEGMLP